MYPPRVERAIPNEVKDPSTVQVSRGASSFSASDRSTFAFGLPDTLSPELTQNIHPTGGPHPPRLWANVGARQGAATPTSAPSLANVGQGAATLGLL
jgi:hypothetical protein